METDIIALSLSAITISFLHTASGPDHYLPFIVLARSRKWSLIKTLSLTVVCGLGHIISSLVIGFVGLGLGWQLSKLTGLQDMRGNLAAWALLLFGVLYLIWGLWRAYSDRPHKHFDIYEHDVYVYQHRHGDITYPQHRIKVTPLVLFAIFVMGPSEPLLPLLFYSGTHRSFMEVGTLVTVFAVCTIVTMVAMVLMGVYGFSFLESKNVERYMHAVSGAVVTVCGAGMVFFGW